MPEIVATIGFAGGLLVGYAIAKIREAANEKLTTKN